MYYSRTIQIDVSFDVKLISEKGENDLRTSWVWQDNKNLMKTQMSSPEPISSVSLTQT